MRRNLRLDWRALALLGALLSIIIDWPVLVYAMPTILSSVTTAAAATAAAAAPASSTSSSAISATILDDTINVIKNDKILNFFPKEHEYDSQDKANDAADADHNKLKNEFTVEILKNSKSFLGKQPISYVNNQEKAPEVVEEEEKRTNIAETEMKVQQRLTINEKQEVNEINNSIRHNNNNHTINIHNNLINKNNSKTAIHIKPGNSLEEQEKAHAEGSAALDKLSSINTHINNSIINSTIATIIMETETTITTTTESSAKIQSTLMPSIIMEDDDQNDQEQFEDTSNNNNINNHNQNEELISSFQFSSSHHMAILSRTERSIRSSSSSNSSGSAAPSAIVGVAAGGGMVRRSSDMSNMKLKRLNNSRNLHHKNNLDRNERSTVSHLSGPSRKIQLYIKNRFLQLMPDGTVNGTHEEQSEYTILQRSTVEVGRIKIQGVATCLYLCMDPCGAVYGSKDFTDDCVFNESMEQHNYNTYSSTYNSNTRRKYYLALNRHGEPRKLQIPPNRSLGKLATYTNAITETVPQERVEQLIAKNFGANRVKHGIRQLCDTGKPLIELIDSKNFKALPKCNPNSSSSNSNSVSKNSNSNSNNNVSSSSNSIDNTNISSSGQLLNNVPAANDKNSLSSLSQSSSSSSNSKPETNSNSSSQSSISNSQNNGHISNSYSNSNTSTSNSNSSSSSSATTSSRSNSDHRGGKKKNKKRKCGPSENEKEHNCKTSLKKPQSMKMGPKKCRDLLQQQQQAGVTDIVLPPICNKKGGAKKQKNAKRLPGEGRGKNGLGTDGLGPNNRRGKKLNMNGSGGGGGRQAANPNQNNGPGSKKKPKNPKRNGGGGNNNKKKQKSTTSTTETNSSPPNLITSTTTLRSKFWETTSLMPSSTLYDSYDPHAETTSDRGEREQRNVRYFSSMEESLEQSSEDTSAAVEEDDEADVDNTEDNEDASYEDDTFIANSSHIPYAAAESSHTPLTGGADDFLYYDQLFDSLPMGLWEFIAVLWIVAWSLQTLS